MSKLLTKFESESIEWETPNDLFGELNDEFQFTLDVCASHVNAKCKTYFTKETNGLTQLWSGVCWMNPPYGRSMVDWLKKAIQETKNGTTTVALIPARTNTGWWHDLCWRHHEVRFVRGRPKFNGYDHGLPQPLAVVIFRPSSEPSK